MINLLWSAVCMVALLSGCGWNDTPTRNNDFTPLTSIVISADSGTIAAGTSTRLSVTGVFLGGMPAGDITNKVVWSSDTPLVASFPYTTSPNKNRVVGGLAPGGTAIITATVGDVSATFKLTVSSAKVTDLTISPPNPSTANGISSQFTVSGRFDDATSQDLTFDSIWDSNDTTVATIGDIVNNKMVVNTHAAGTSTIKATFDAVSGTTLLTVTAPVLQSIAISPTNPSILTLSTGNFKAIGTYSDSSTSDISSQVIWNSSNTAIATIAGDGTATTLTQGTTTLKATLDGINGTTDLRATGGNLTGITISPAFVTLVKDTTGLAKESTGRISASGTFINGATVVSRDITGAVTWTPANTSIATVTKAGGTLAWLNPLAVTLVPTTITATSGSLTATAALTIADAQLISIALSTDSPELNAGLLTAGTSARFTATATFNINGTITTQDVTTLSSWISDAPTTATVEPSGLEAGRVTGVATGSTKISASYTYNGIKVTTPAPVNNVNVTVKQLTLQSLAISPDTSNMTAGNQATFKAIATYIGGTTVDVTNDTIWTWVTDKPNVAILSDSVNQPGKVLAVDSGTATLTASFGGKSPDHNATITVTGP